MIKFDVNNLRVETYYVKSLTTALGGAITILDETNSTDDRERYHRIPVPLAVVRQFKLKYKTMQYIHPCLIAVTFYDDRVIALERHPSGCMGGREERQQVKNKQGVLEWQTKLWTPIMQYNINAIIRPVVCATPIWDRKNNTFVKRNKHDWFFDGRYVFTLEQTPENAIRKGEFLSKNGKFRCIDVKAFNLQHLADSDKLLKEKRTSLAYVANDAQFAISPPIWKDATAVGQAKIKGTNKEGTDRDLKFDRVDEFCAVNLSFALRAAKLLSEEFGFEAIEPLNLPELMIKLNTVNLPRISSEVKDTFDSGLKFTHALAWLLGFCRRCKTLDTYASIRSLLKYLTSNGLYFKHIFDPKNIFREGHDLDSIPLLSKSEALANVDLLTIDQRLDIIRGQREQLRNHPNINIVDGVIDE